MKTTKYIVMYDANDGICIPQGWDEDCEGALCCSNKPVIFTNHKDAKTAIAISVAFAKLRKAQGKPENEDYLGNYLKNIKIAPCEEVGVTA